MHGPNVWPDTQALPGWQEGVQRYFSDMLELSRVVARGLALSLSLPPAFFTDRMQDPVAQLLLLRYPPPPAPSGGGGADGSEQQQQQQQQYVGCGAHTDCGFLTILAQVGEVVVRAVRLARGAGCALVGRCAEAVCSAAPWLRVCTRRTRCLGCK
jgi:isopenicillin N synthase-like dioxygenase